MGVHFVFDDMDDSVAGFDWDDGNAGKCQKHGVTIEAIEKLFRSSSLRAEPDIANSIGETRFRAVGRTEEGRAIFVVFTLRVRGTANLIRPISARYMHKKEIDAHEKEIP